jgi:membrane protease YdiL (CAAX protease family)
MMPASGGRAIWLLACLRLKRLANLFTSLKFKAKPGQASRPPTRAKRRMGGLFVVLMAACMLFSFSSIARQSVLNLECHLSPTSQCVEAKASGHERDGDEIATRELLQDGFSPPLARAMTLQLALLLVVSFLTPLASREIANTDGDLEWLVTMPVKRTILLLARIVERSVANPTGLMAMMPVCMMVAWFAGFRWSVPLLGLAGALALLSIAAVLRTVVDTGLRMVLTPSQLRNLQAVCGVGSLPFMYLAMSFGMPSASTIGIPMARATPGWMLWTPPGLVIEALIAATPAHAVAMIGILLVELAACLAVGLAVLRQQLRNGVVASGVRESARRPKDAPRHAATGNSMWRRLLPRSAIQRRELRLLGRDRNFLMQSLVMPIVIVAPQFFFNSRHGSLAEMGSHPVALAMAAWGISAYMLMLSAFQTLNNEGQVLWMLYTFPRSLESVLKEKAKLWAVLALAYPVAVLAVGISLAPAFDWHILSTCAIVLAGVPVYSMIAVALGVFASDPLAQDARTRLRPSYLYLYMLLAGLYGYAIYAELWWQTVSVMVLTVCLAQALWQKARDALPFLLDPAAAPPSRVSTADGMMAAMLFFVLQAVAGLILVRGAETAPGQAIVFGFAIAGALVYVLTRYTYWRTKTVGVPNVLPEHAGRAFGWGLGLGLAAAAVGLAYLLVLRTTPWWAGQAQANAGLHIQTYWLLLLTVLLAPLCEEFIFRGLVFGGLRRSIGLPLSMVMSAALFAIVHPPVSMLPVFGLGLLTAYAYERGKGLLAPMLVHAIYNAVVVGYQLSL